MYVIHFNHLLVSSVRDVSLFRLRSVCYRKFAFEMEWETEYNDCECPYWISSIIQKRLQLRLQITTAYSKSCSAMQWMYPFWLLPIPSTTPTFVSTFMKAAVVVVGRAEPGQLQRYFAYVVLSAVKMLTTFVNIATSQLFVKNCIGASLQEDPTESFNSEFVPLSDFLSLRNRICYPFFKFSILFAITLSSVRPLLPSAMTDC